ncbi:MAG: hypothetical protein V4695_11890 [Pseudomonadota bacterium]
MSSDDNPMQHPEEQPATTGAGSPRFGRLLAILIAAVILISLIAVGAQAYFS